MGGFNVLNLGGIELFRGMKRADLERAKDEGILCGARVAGNLALIDEFARVYFNPSFSHSGSIIQTIISGHLGGEKETPLVSASPYKHVAEQFALRDDEVVARITVPVKYVIMPPQLRVPIADGIHTTEVLIFDQVFPSEVKGVVS
jgi:hypothetical protein